MDTELGLTILQAVAVFAALTVAMWAAIQSHQTGRVLEATHDLLEDFNIAFGVKAGLEGGAPYIHALNMAFMINEMIEDGTISEEQAERLQAQALAHAEELNSEKLKELFKDAS